MLWQGDWRHRLANGQYSVSLPRSIKAASTPALAERSATPTGGARCKPGVSSRCRPGGATAGTSRSRATRPSAASTSSIPILQTDRVNIAYLQGMSDRNYFGANLYHFGGLLLNDTELANSVVHPVIDYNYIWDSPVAGGELSFTSHARAMTRTDGTDTNHAVVEANWRRKMIDPIGQVWTPFANVRGDVYSYANALNPNDPNLTIPDDTVTRGMATGGVTYSYPFVAHAGWASHVLAPTAQIIARPNYRFDQRRLPDEDAQKPHLRRHAAVRRRQVFRLRPPGNRHSRQSRRAIHDTGQQRCLRARGVRPEHSPGGRKCLRRSWLYPWTVGR